MRHHVSANQLVLWSHHALNPAWTSAGVWHRAQTDETPDDVTADSSHPTGGEIEPKRPVSDATSALRCAHGRAARERTRTAQDTRHRLCPQGTYRAQLSVDYRTRLDRP